MDNKAGVNSPLDPLQQARQTIQDAQHEDADYRQKVRDAQAAVNEAMRTTDVWESKLRRHVELMLVEFANPRFGGSDGRNGVLQRLREVLAATKAALWP
jgi:hypothetical protein